MWGRRGPRCATRVLGGVAAGALAGLAVGFLGEHWGLRYIRVPMGLAVGTADGILVALVWQCASRFGERTGLALGAFVLAASLGLFALLFVFVLSDIEVAARAAHLGPASLARVAVYDANRHRILREVRAPRELRRFAACLADARPYWPNHPGYLRSWYVRIEGAGPPTELECSYTASNPHDMVCAMVRTSGRSTWMVGGFSSRRLRGWFEANVPGASGTGSADQDTVPRCSPEPRSGHEG